MIFPENTAIINTISEQFNKSIPNDPVSVPRIAVLRRSTPFYNQPYHIKQDMYIIALYDCYIISKPEYDTSMHITEVIPKALDGQQRLRELIHQRGFEILHDDCFDENLKGFFERAHQVNREIIVLPRYHPEELVGELLFKTEKKTLTEGQKNTLFDPKLFFTLRGFNYDINNFIGVINDNGAFGNKLNHFKINGQNIVFMNNRGLYNMSGDWVLNNEDTIWSQVLYNIAGFINAKLPSDKRDLFINNGWKERVGNIVMTATYSTCYLTYMILKTQGKIK